MMTKTKPKAPRRLIERDAPSLMFVYDGAAMAGSIMQDSGGGTYNNLRAAVRSLPKARAA